MARNCGNLLLFCQVSDVCVCLVCAWECATYSGIRLWSTEYMQRQNITAPATEHILTWVIRQTDEKPPISLEIHFLDTFHLSWHVSVFKSSRKTNNQQFSALKISMNVVFFFLMPFTHIHRVSLCVCIDFKQISSIHFHFQPISCGYLLLIFRYPFEWIQKIHTKTGFILTTYSTVKYMNSVVRSNGCNVSIKFLEFDLKLSDEKFNFVMNESPISLRQHFWPNHFRKYCNV